MADSLRLVARAQAPSGAGTTDHTVSGFGTPTAAIIISQIGGVDSDAAHMALSVGFWDGSADALTAFAHQDAVSFSAAEESTTRNTAVVYHDVDSLGIRSATASNITDGIRLTWDSGTAFQPYATVILISANSAAAGTFQAAGTDGGTTDVTGLGFTPNFVFMSTHYGTTLNGQSASCMLNSGFASDESGGITLRAAGVRQQDSGSATDAATMVHTDMSTAAFSRSAELTTYELTAFASGQFTVTTRQVLSSQAHQHSYLALNLDTVPKLFNAATPTSAGDWDPYTDTEERQSYLFWVSPASITDGLDTTPSEDIGGMGWYFVNTEGEEEGGFVCSEHGVTTRNTSGRMSDKMIIQDDFAGAPVFDATSPTFDSTGLVFSSANVSEDSTVHNVIGAAFGTVAASTTLPEFHASNRGIARGINRGVG